MTTLSIIIPVFNTEKYINNCVETIVSQIYTDFEIILVNAGSTDKSGEICDIWAEKDNRIKVIHNTKNGNICAAKNAGLNAASGQYIIFADCSSIFPTDVLEKCMSEISSHSPDILACAVKAPADSNRSKIYIDSNMYTRAEYTETIARYISTGIGFSTLSNKIFRTDIIKLHNIHFDECLPLVAEELFNCRFFSSCSHIRCTDIMLCTHDTNCTITDEYTADYLNQGKIYSQALIDAVQSKGLYGAASQAIGENYQKILYKHLVLLSLPSEKHSLSERASVLEELSNSSDYAPLMMYLASQRGIKNTYIYQMYKLRQWKLLLATLGK